MITVTEKAARKIQELIRQEGKQGWGVRLAVAGGCSGMRYALAFDEKPQDGRDEVVRFDGFDVFVDAVSATYLRGAEIDYIETDQGEGFQVLNPNERRSGGGEPFAV